LIVWETRGMTRGCAGGGEVGGGGDWVSSHNKGVLKKINPPQLH